MKLDFVNLIPYISDTGYFWYQIFLIPDITDTQYIWYPIYLIWYLIFSYTHISDTHIPDTPYFWYPIFQIPHISDTQYLLYPIFMIHEISDIRYLWYFWYMNLFLIPNRATTIWCQIFYSFFLKNMKQNTLLVVLIVCWWRTLSTDLAVFHQTYLR